MEGFKGWLLEKKNWNCFKDAMGQDELERVLMELGEAPVGIGSKGVYQATYGFAAEVCHWEHMYQLNFVKHSDFW